MILPKGSKFPGMVFLPSPCGHDPYNSLEGCFLFKPADFTVAEFKEGILHLNKPVPFPLLPAPTPAPHKPLAERILGPLL